MKTYSSKSNAKRAAIKAGHDIDQTMIVKGNDGKWGIYPKEVEPATPAAPAPATPAPAAPVKKATRKRVEREQQNGVFKPNAGKCRNIWDWCELVYVTNVDQPTVADVRAQAEHEGWNTTNAVIEFYNWRKFNGISGRVKKS